MKVGRRQEVPHAADPERRYLRFTTGKVVDPLECPERIQAHFHWAIDPDRDAEPGQPNTVCEHNQQPSVMD